MFQFDLHSSNTAHCLGSPKLNQWTTENTSMKDFTQTTARQALELSEFRDWKPDFDVKHLNRPRLRPAKLDGNGRFGAVLLLLCNDSGSTKIVLTKRAEHLSHHAGQISLPGGRLEPGETAEQAALRETEEEVGVAAGDIQILGQLNQVYIPPSDFTVSPLVGWIEGLPNFQAAPAEVDEIVVVSLTQLLDPATLSSGTIEVDGRRLDVPFYKVNEHRVWGATAIILREFLLRTSVVLGINK